MSLVLIFLSAFQALPGDGEPYFLSVDSEARLTGHFETCVAPNVHANDAWEIACIRREQVRQDLKLNQTYQYVMSRLTGPKARALREQERRWIRDRDRYCDLVGGGTWAGTLGDVNLHTCLLDETIKRTIWLERYR